MHAPVKSDPIVVRASAVLPPAGAFDALAIAIPLGDYSEVLLRVQYTRGGAAGSTMVFPFVSDQEKGTYFPLGLDDNTLVSTTPVSHTTIFQLQKLFAAPAGAGVTLYTVTFSIKTSKWAKFFFAEVGNAGTPGTVAADCILGSPQLA